MRLDQVLFSQGFGTRRDCAGLLRHGEVEIDGQVQGDPAAEFATEALVFKVRGQPWVFQERALVMLYKPAGYECSQKPRHHPSVLTLLPAPLRARGVQPVGRLDEDTTGLLLLTDDGTLIHRLTSPKHHVPKLYQVGTKHEVSDAQVQALLDGVVLDDAPMLVRAAACVRTGERTLDLTLTEGKYHQVKRMVAAAGNRVEALHRASFGDWVLPADMLPGTWRWAGAAGAVAGA